MSEKPFWITSFKAEQEIENRLAAAGEDFHSTSELLTKWSALAAFLELNELTTRRLTKSDGRIDETFVLQSTDLTPTGLQLIRKAYEKWQRQAKTPDDIRPLEKALATLRR